MPQRYYAFQYFDATKHVRAAIREKTISHKHAREIATAMKGLSLEKARDYLLDVTNFKRSIPFGRYKNQVGHRSDPGTMSGRYPQKAATEILKLLEKKLILSLDSLIRELKNKSKQFNRIIKIGRTHTQDATPITLGQEFSGYLEQIKNNKHRLLNAKKELYFLAQGGTAVGTGINAHKNFDKVFCKYLSKLTKTKYLPASNKFESIASHDSLVNLSAALNTLSVSLLKITNDIRFLASGPRSGLGELQLPENEPGSSIMPGKINPTQIEALSMVCARGMGNHTSISIAGSQGHFELNAFKPLIIYNIIQSINLLSDSIESFNKKCLKGIKANNKRISKNLNNSLMLVTALNNYIGYDNAAKIARKAFKENISLRESANKLGILSKKEFDRIVQPKKMI